jgi:dual-specificity kinase
MMEAVCGCRIDTKLIRAVMSNGRGSSNQAAKLVSSISHSYYQNPTNQSRYFKNNKLDYPGKETTKPSRKYVNAMKVLHVSLALTRIHTLINMLMMLQDIIPATTDFNKQFLNLLRRIFVYDPNKRITAKEALKHPWFRETLTDDGTEAIRIRKERERELEMKERELRDQAIREREMEMAQLAANGYR